ncbi:MAG: FeoB-associated Cys-rich membrane protein [Clostridia bacterium]|nr:FeoB-associated Cys-rich membrane protein [Clostridia bacterium]
MPWPTIIVGAVVAIIFVAIVVNEIKKRKQGKGGCSCGCSGCALKDSCHPQNKPPES